MGTPMATTPQPVPTPGGLTLDVVGAVIELQLEDVVGRAVGVQGARHLPAPDEAVLAAQDNDGPVDQLHHKMLRLTCAGGGRFVRAAPGGCRTRTPQEEGGLCPPPISHPPHLSPHLQAPEMVIKKTYCLYP